MREKIYFYPTNLRKQARPLFQTWAQTFSRNVHVP